MKQVKRIKYRRRTVQVEVTVMVITKPTVWTRAEAKHVMNAICAGVMTTLPEVKYLAAPLAEVKVT